MLERLLCIALRRHHFRVRRTAGRVFLECLRCGASTPGWEMGSSRSPAPRAMAPLRLLFAENAVPLPIGDATSALAAPPSRTVPLPESEFRLHLDA